MRRGEDLVQDGFLAGVQWATLRLFHASDRLLTAGRPAEAQLLQRIGRATLEDAPQHVEAVLRDMADSAKKVPRG
jgi:hypothetical protein